MFLQLHLWHFLVEWDLTMSRDAASVHFKNVIGTTTEN